MAPTRRLCRVIISEAWHLRHTDYPPGEWQQVGFQSETLSLYHGRVRINAALEPAGLPARLAAVEIRAVPSAANTAAGTADKAHLFFEPGAAAAHHQV
ncbi:MAG: hypothetical protein Kow0096_02010 [Thiohalomonadaceae bacterium]